MRRLIVVVIVVALVVGLAAPAAQARHSTTANVALGLAAFAVFNQLVSPIFHPRVHTHTHVVEAVPVVSARPILYYPPAPVYPVPAQSVVVTPPPPTAMVAPPPPIQTVVQYPHGRYELRGDGIREPYTWVWIPNPPPPPPPPAAPPQ